jgi:hypothetical protein
MGLFEKLIHGSPKHRSARLGARVPMDLRINVRVARDGAIHSVFLEDLSSSGARISTPMKFSRSDVLSLIVETDKGERLHPVCRIASIRPRRGELHIDYGLKFVALKPGDAEAVRKYVARQLTQRTAGTTAFTSARFR